jgi:hypothetical protein
MNAPHAKVNRMALWTAVSVIASRPLANQDTESSPATPQPGHSPDSLAVRVSANGTTLCLTEYRRQVTRSAATETLHGFSDGAIVTEFALADQTGRRFHAVRRRFASQ